MAQAFPELGRTFEEKYQLKSIIGEGGFARIYRAEQTDLGRAVALKILDPDRDNRDDSEITVERFRREARLVASLRDPHTITLHEHGQTETGLLYLVFEYVDGKSLNEVLAQSGRLDPERVVKIVRQTLMSLQEAHAQGVLHRDIKPGNIMLYEHMGRGDQVKVLDFGIAKAVLSDDDATTAQDLTKADTVVGTPRYMAPEQFRSVDPEPASDIYSLGLVAYELLVGVKAVAADSLVNVITEHVSGEPIRLPENAPVGSGLREVVNGMLDPELERRYQSADAVLEALDELDEDDIVGERDPDTDGPALSPEVPSTREAFPEEEVSHKTLYAAVGVGVAAALGLAVYLLGGTIFQGEPSESSSAQAASEASPARVTIDTVPEAVPVKIDDVYVGESPVEVPIRTVEFPAVVSATTPDGRTTEVSLEEPTKNLTLRLPAADEEAGKEGAGPDVGTRASADATAGGEAVGSKSAEESNPPAAGSSKAAGGPASESSGAAAAQGGAREGDRPGAAEPGETSGSAQESPPNGTVESEEPTEPGSDDGEQRSTDGSPTAEAAGGSGSGTGTESQGESSDGASEGSKGGGEEGDSKHGDSKFFDLTEVEEEE